MSLILLYNNQVVTKTLRDSLAHQPVELSFGTSGLRGLALDMTDLECYINTRGFINFLTASGNAPNGAKVALAGDLRDSTPRILKAVAQALTDSGCQIVYLGLVPTPAAAYYGLTHNLPVAMVTGSHIPADRNGIKFYKRGGEVLKADEAAIKQAVKTVRQQIYSSPFEETNFDNDGGLKQAGNLPKIEAGAITQFLDRYKDFFAGDTLAGRTVVVYQHSSLAADLLVKLLEAFGAEVIPVGRSSSFIPIDTENVTSENQAYFRELAKQYPHNFAIVSADGDADRPFIIDETGTFHRGDVVGALVAEFLKARSAVVPISASDAVDQYLGKRGIKLTHTKIGSPYVIAAMAEALATGLAPVVGWEVNGGFMTGGDIVRGNKKLLALPTRDAFLPIIGTLLLAARQKKKLSVLFGQLPQRFTQAGLIDNFPIASSQAILAKYGTDSAPNRQSLEAIFTKPRGFGPITNVNSMDGVRISFKNGDIAHVRPSGNAPQLRIYSVADSQQRADEIVNLALAEPDGLLRRLAASIKSA